ncbi:MAG: hypothetical protein WA709_00860 [Stellaceae bacterium]
MLLVKLARCEQWQASNSARGSVTLALDGIPVSSVIAGALLPFDPTRRGAAPDWVERVAVQAQIIML